MAIYLIRHTTPLVAAGTCYGQANVDVTDTFTDEAEALKIFYPNTIDQVYSSPLLRCKKLAQFIEPNKNIIEDSRIMEINCGDWELKKWDDIPRQETEPWMNDFVNIPFKNGENYTTLQNRCVSFFNQIFDANKNIAVFTHAGVKRSLLAYINKVALIDSFKHFNIPYGSITKITQTQPNTFVHETIYAKNFPVEVHRPSYMKI
jgi:alpha-ribazole phosphatase